MGRAPCCDKVGLKKGRWSKEEDDILARFISTYGPRSWRSMPKRAGLLRCGKSCRLRWINYLRADVKRGNFSPDEDRIIINLHSSIGNRWSLIAGHLPGRTDNEIKNYWNSHLSRTIHSFPEMNAEETNPATSISSVTNNPESDDSNKMSNHAIEEDDNQYSPVDNIQAIMNPIERNNEEGVAQPQPELSPTTTSSSASCVSISIDQIENQDKAASGLLSSGPLSPLDDNALLDIIDTLLEDSWAHDMQSGSSSGFSSLEGDQQQQVVIMGQTSNDLGSEWLDMEAQLWGESDGVWSGLGKGGLHWETVSDWLLSDN